jgi:hypothetical protein
MFRNKTSRNVQTPKFAVQWYTSWVQVSVSRSFILIQFTPLFLVTPYKGRERIILHAFRLTMYQLLNYSEESIRGGHNAAGARHWCGSYKFPVKKKLRVFVKMIAHLADSSTSTISLPSQLKALIAFSQTVNSVAIVRLTWQIETQLLTPACCTNS